MSLSVDQLPAPPSPAPSPNVPAGATLDSLPTPSALTVDKLPAPPPPKAKPISTPWAQASWNQPIPQPSPIDNPADFYAKFAVGSGLGVSGSDVMRMVGEWEKQFGRRPTNGELNTLIGRAATADQADTAHQQKTLAQWGRASALVEEGFEAIGVGPKFPWVGGVPLNVMLRKGGRGANPARGYWSVMLDPKMTFSEKLDYLGANYGINAPADIAYWAMQPNVAEGLADAKATTANGVALQIALGIHADLARWKPAHPFVTGIETMALSSTMPSFTVGAGLARAASRAGSAAHTAAAAGKFGTAGIAAARAVSAAARVAAQTPLVGDRFFAMQSVYGARGAQLHDLLVRDMGNAAYTAMEDFTHPQTFGGISLEDEHRVVDIIENPGELLGPSDKPLLPPEGPKPLRGGPTLEGPQYGGPVGSARLQRGFIDLGGGYEWRRVGEATLGDRAALIGSIIRRDEADLIAIDPEMAGRMISRPGYFPREGSMSDNPTWLQDRSGKTNPWDVQNRGTGGGTGAIHDDMRTWPTIFMGKELGGLQLNPQWVAAASAAKHAARIRRYVSTLKRIYEMGSMRDSAGNAGLMDAEYIFDARLDAQKPGGVNYTGVLVPQSVGGAGRTDIINFGTGRAGFDSAETFVRDYGVNRATAAAELQPSSISWTPQYRSSWIARKAAEYEDSAWDNMRANFEKKYPDHKFHTDRLLQMPALKGKALRAEGVWMVRDAHPALQKLKTGEIPTSLDLHKEYDAGPSAPIAWLENTNALVRQGLLSNFAFHPFFNILPLALKSGVPRDLVAKAFLGQHVPKEWLAAAERDGANSPRFGGAYTISPTLRAKILTVPFSRLSASSVGTKGFGGSFAEPGTMRFDGGLTPSEMGLKAALYASRKNQDITFGYFEDRLAAVWHNHNTTALKMTPAESARMIRKVLGDYENLTAAERAAGLNSWFYFYTWMKTRLRDAASDLVFNPKAIMAPIAGVARANQLAGAPSIYDNPGQNPLALGIGKDDHGEQRFVSAGTLFPQARYGEQLLNIVGSPLATKGGFTSLDQATRLASAHFTPLAGLAWDAAFTVAGRPVVPEAYNQELFDPLAPIGTQIAEALTKEALRYSPFQIQSVVAAVKSKDPYELIGAGGPAVYSLPTQAQSKLVASAEYGLESLLKQPLTDPQRAYILDLRRGIADGDPLSVSQANALVKSMNKVRVALRRHG